MKKLLMVCLLMAGCSALPSTAVKVEVPVLVPCIISHIDTPAFAVDSLSIDAGIWSQMLALRADRIQRKAYEHVLTEAMKACQK